MRDHLQVSIFFGPALAQTETPYSKTGSILTSGAMDKRVRFH
jgi:hypothetical protein